MVTQEGQDVLKLCFHQISTNRNLKSQANKAENKKPYNSLKIFCGFYAVTLIAFQEKKKRRFYLLECKTKQNNKTKVLILNMLPLIYFVNTSRHFHDVQMQCFIVKSK